ncbi:hypothetical protein FB451DRAFT_1412761 [Mycena latifolia]|nr:hypothetical protein FB451DRAFT_1412761 [Mycena latifolia]
MAAASAYMMDGRKKTLDYGRYQHENSSKSDFRSPIFDEYKGSAAELVGVLIALLLLLAAALALALARLVDDASKVPSAKSVINAFASACAPASASVPPCLNFRISDSCARYVPPRRGVPWCGVAAVPFTTSWVAYCVLHVRLSYGFLIIFSLACPTFICCTIHVPRTFSHCLLPRLPHHLSSRLGQAISTPAPPTMPTRVIFPARSLLTRSISPLAPRIRKNTTVHVIVCLRAEANRRLFLIFVSPSNRGSELRIVLHGGVRVKVLLSGWIENVRGFNSGSFHGWIRRLQY